MLNKLKHLQSAFQEKQHCKSSRETTISLITRILIEKYFLRVLKFRNLPSKREKIAGNNNKQYICTKYVQNIVQITNNTKYIKYLAHRLKYHIVYCFE